MVTVKPARAQELEERSLAPQPFDDPQQEPTTQGEGKGRARACTQHEYRSPTNHFRCLAQRARAAFRASARRWAGVIRW